MTRLAAGVRPFGSHGYQTVLGFVEPHSGFGFDGHRFMDVVANAHWIYGGLRSLDGEKYYTFFRHYNNHGALGFTAFEADTDANGHDSDFHFDKRSKNAFLGAALAEQHGDGWGVRDIFDGPPRFEVRMSATHAHWFERDLVEITGEPLGHAIQACVPDAHWPLVYNHRAMRCEGTFLGRDVEGFIQMDYVDRQATRPGSRSPVSKIHHDGRRAASFGAAKLARSPPPMGGSRASSAGSSM